MKSWDKDILGREQLVKDPEVKKGFRCWRKQKKTNVVNNCPHVCRGSRPSPKGDLAYWNVLKLILGSWISALIIMLNLPEETASFLLGYFDRPWIWGQPFLSFPPRGAKRDENHFLKSYHRACLLCLLAPPVLLAQDLGCQRRTVCYDDKNFYFQIILDQRSK